MGRFDHRATQPARGPKDMLRWKVLDTLAGRRRSGTGAVAQLRENDGTAVRGLHPSLTWIGHASFVLRLGGRLIATDPIWSTRIAGAIPRLVPPGLRLQDIPPIDVVTVSHNHFDHLDLPTLQQIGPRATYVVPLGVGELLLDAGLERVIELDWWQTTHAAAGLQVTLVPSRHWSMRAPWDRNESLWGGFVIRGLEGAAYHSGDTGYFDGFAEIRERCGAIDWAMLPIGAYDPRWFMHPQHVNPEEAGEAFLALGAKTFVAMHWGTFKLTDEPLDEPVSRIRAWWDARNLDRERLWLLDVGETRHLTSGG